MKNPAEEKAFYERLKEQLDDTTKFPSLYLYKFIVPSSEEKVKEVVSFFDNSGAVINTKTSSKGNYISVSISVTMESSQAVIDKYKAVSVVEGVISL
jgi:putative lipoic acid-binding regulatory protein